MADGPRSNRPLPRTSAAIEAELRRKIRLELEQARGESDGELDDATLAGIIARAVAAALEWHLQAPEHTRNATLSSRSWRPAPGPRGGRQPENQERGPREFDRPPREYDRPPRDYDRPPPRDFDRPPRDFDRPRRDFNPPPRDNDRDRDRNYPDNRGPRDFRPGPRRGGGGGGFKRGGFGPRRPPRPR